MNPQCSSRVHQRLQQSRHPASSSETTFADAIAKSGTSHAASEQQKGAKGNIETYRFRLRKCREIPKQLESAMLASNVKPKATDHKYKASGLVIVMLALGFHSKPKVLPYKLLRPSKLIAEAQHPMLTTTFGILSCTLGSHKRT